MYNPARMRGAGRVGEGRGPAAPLVSVVVPNYNHLRFLPRRLESIRTQTFRDFELILLDDASTDGSRELLRRQAGDPATRVILGERNSGSTFAQWDIGVREARGTYVWIAESDDDADPRLLEVLVPLLERNPGVGLAYCDSEIIDEDGRVTGTPARTPFEPEAAHWDRAFVADGREEIRRFLFHDNMIPNASAVLLRRSVFLDAGWADASLRLAGDWFQWLRMLLISDLAYDPRRLNRFRRHPGTVRAQTAVDGRRELEALRVQAWIAGRLRIDRESRARSVGRYAEAWLQAVRAACYRGSLLGHARFFRGALRLDGREAARFARRLPLCLAISALKRTVFRGRYLSPQPRGVPGR